MKDIDTDKMKELAEKTDAKEAEMVYHPSIKALVKILARKAAEENYNEFLRVLKNSQNEDKNHD